MFFFMMGSRKLVPLKTSFLDVPQVEQRFRLFKMQLQKQNKKPSLGFITSSDVTGSKGPWKCHPFGDIRAKDNQAIVVVRPCCRKNEQFLQCLTWPHPWKQCCVIKTTSILSCTTFRHSHEGRHTSPRILSSLVNVQFYFSIFESPHTDVWKTPSPSFHLPKNNESWIFSKKGKNIARKCCCDKRYADRYMYAPVLWPEAL